jgi:hypothetical protein
LRHEALDGFGVPKIELVAGCGYNFALFTLEPPQDGGARHAGMSGDIDAPAAEIEKDRRADLVY